MLDAYPKYSKRNPGTDRLERYELAFTEPVVRNLRQRIFRASREGNQTKKGSLAAKTPAAKPRQCLLSVRRVTQDNEGKNTPGVDRLGRSDAPKPGASW